MRKQQYFTEDTIQKQTDYFLRKFRRYPAEIDMKNSALLVIDMQLYFTRPESHAFVPSAPAIIPGIRRLIKVFSKSDMPVLFSKHENNGENAGMMEKWWRDLIYSSDELSEIAPDLNSALHPVIVKDQYDVFYKTDLDKILKDKNIRQVAVAGAMTHLCVETTARSAFVRGFEVLAPVDGTATYNQEFHEATLRNLAHGFAHLTSVEEIVKRMNFQIR